MPEASEPEAKFVINDLAQARRQPKKTILRETSRDKRAQRARYVKKRQARMSFVGHRHDRRIALHDEVLNVEALITKPRTSYAQSMLVAGEIKLPFVPLKFRTELPITSR
jgi:hypothetical protein